MRHPLAILALVVLVLNDHVWKQAYPGLVTGKLSDVAGLAFFPLFLAELLGRRLSLGLCALLTACVFTAVKLTPLGGDAYRYGLAALQWPWRALAGRPFAPVQLAKDATDLAALPAVLVSLWTARGSSPTRTAP
jgi:hypothetical protein